MVKVDLTDALPKVTRPLDDRMATSAEDRILSRRLQKEYFDGTRQQGYGGYYYDGRWKPVVHRFREYYGLAHDASILDIGCAKGFLLHDFLVEMPGVTVAGIDFSGYALGQATHLVKPFLCLGNAMNLPFPDNHFDLVVAINSLHNNLDRQETVQALREIERVSRGHKFVKLGAYDSQEEKDRLDNWAVVSKTYLDPASWLELFAEAGYTGDYFWFKP